MAMRTILLVVEYDGSRYYGWQLQKKHLTLQKVMEDAISRLLDETRVVVHAASRTDAGVHALGQLVSFRTEKRMPLAGFFYGINNLLPEDVRVIDVLEMQPDFHPRIHSQGKIYEYHIRCSLHPPAIDRQRVFWLKQPLDVQAMTRAAQHLLGEHDFSSFQAAGCSAYNSIRTIFSCQIREYSPLLEGDARVDQAVCVVLHATAFLKYMVRNIVGTLVDVGHGRIDEHQFKAILETKCRSTAGKTAPPQGLFLKKIYLPEEWIIARLEGCR